MVTRKRVNVMIQELRQYCRIISLHYVHISTAAVARMCINNIRFKTTPVFGTSCCLTKQKECFMIPEEREVNFGHLSQIEVTDALQINDVTLLFMRPFSHDQRSKQHQTLCARSRIGSKAAFMNTCCRFTWADCFIRRVGAGEGRKGGDSVRICHGSCFRHDGWWRN